MRGYNNARAAKRGGKQWYYNYCVRLLMERVTDYCLRDSLELFFSRVSLRLFSVRAVVTPLAKQRHIGNR